MLGQFVQALEDARTSVKLDPTFVRGYVRVAKCCVALGEIHAAKQVTKKMSNWVTLDVILTASKYRRGLEIDLLLLLSLLFLGPNL